MDKGIWRDEMGGLPRIGFDLDNTTFDFRGAFSSYLLSKGFVVPEGESGLGFLRKSTKLSDVEKQSLEMKFYDSPFFLEMPPLPRAVDAVSYLSQKSNPVVITSRDASLIEKTRYSILKHFPNNFCGLFHTKNEFNGANPTYPTKADVCWNLGVTEMFEDEIKYGEPIVRRGISVTLLGRRNGTGEIPRLTFIENWDKFLEMEKSLGKIK